MVEKGDFTANRHLLKVSAMALFVGGLCAFVALGLLKLISFFTNLFFFGTISTQPSSPSDSHLGLWIVLIPAIGGLLIGLLARYGSSRIRGHGIPEAMEAILIGRSKMEPKVAVLKPLSSAISIGSGGPFGAEGPIIMTGGAFGSIIAQWFRLTAAERKTLLVAGAAGGMAATFGTPVAATLLAVELLLFEWKPRSLVPVAIAAAVAAALRPYLIGGGPLFTMAPHAPLESPMLWACVIVGLVGGLASCLLTAAVYGAEDFFPRLPIHWMWWPALGGLVVGLGGLLQPRAMGVGYDIIEELLQGKFLPGALILLVVVKASIWAISLGSGTSGGVLAPLLIIGGGIGALESHFLPASGSSLWPLLGMAAVLGGTMRCPLTGIVFALELTYDVGALPALLITCVTAYAFTVLAMKRSILTEKVSRRGYHLSREYSVDPLELITMGEIMSKDVVTVPFDLRARDLEKIFFESASVKGHQGYPVVDAEGHLRGVVTRSTVIERRVAAGTEGRIVDELIQNEPVVAYPDETCRTGAERMASAKVGRLVIVPREDPRRIRGIVTRSDLLKARAHHMDLEERREQIFYVPWASKPH